MVGIVAGSGLGLDASSLQAPGAKGLLGNPNEGKTGESIYVNATNGNLIIRDQDEMLLGQGMAAQIFRSYNSQGDGWHSGTTPTVAELTGTLNALGSTVTRTDWDGLQITYSWDTSRSAYVSMTPAGARQTITGDGAHWTLRDDTTNTIDTYDATQGGRLVSRNDLDGNTTTFAYNAAGLLARVTTGSQESVTLSYDTSNRLISLSSTYASADGSLVTSTLTRYGYDAQGRLSTVSVDLSPDDGSAADGNVVTTTYAYNGTSDQIASIIHSDGSSVSFTYLNGSIASVIETTASGISNTTKFTFTRSSTQVLATINDATGIRRLVSGVDGHIVSTISGASPTDTYLYDTNGRVVRWSAFQGRITSYTYDAAGNVTRTVDSAGNVVDRTFSTHNELLSEWRYTAPVTADAAGNRVIAAGATTTQSFVSYAYDAEQHLRFAISAEGRVTEYRYNAAGQQASKIVYTQATYPIDPLGAADQATEGKLTTWLSTIDLSASQRTDIQYDFRGQVSIVSTYATTGADGAGFTSPDDVLQTRYVYDAHGRLLQRFSGASGSVRIETDTYDGLGRLTSTTASDGEVTLYQYSESSRTLVQRFANGLVRTSTFDAADRLISRVDSGPTGAIARTSYTYDAAGRLVAMTDADGGVHTYAYDARNRKTAEIDPAGQLITYTYDLGDHLTTTIIYATRVDATLREAIAAGSTGRPATSFNDRQTWFLYDANDHVVKTVDGEGAVIDSVYDASGQLVETIARATHVSVATTPTLANATVADSDADRITYLFHDKDGLLIGQLDAEGYLTETRYNAASQRIETIGYATAVPVALRTGTGLATLRPAVTASDIHARYIYDDRGLLTDAIDGEGNLTSYTYDSYGNIASRTQGARISPADLDGRGTPVLQFTAHQSTGLPGTSPLVVYVDGVAAQTVTLPANGASATFYLDLSVSRFADHVITFDGGSAPVSVQGVTLDGQSIQAQSDLGNHMGVSFVVDARQLLNALNAAATDVTTYTYDARGRLLQTTTTAADRADDSTSYVYDAMGHVIEARGPSRATMYRYDLAGHVIAQLNGRGVAALDALGASPSADQVEAVWSAWATRYTYDAAGLMTSQADATGAQTVFYYDLAGHLTAQVNALGEASLREYDSLGNLVRTTVFGRRLSPADMAALTGGLYDGVMAAKLATINGADASVATMKYTVTGRLSEMDSPLGHVVRYTYDTFGGLIRTLVIATNPITYNQTTNTFDHLGRVVSTEVLANGVGAALTTRKVYDAFGRVTESIDANGVHRFSQYDRAGHIIAQTDGMGVTTHSTYDALGRVLSRTDGNGHTATYAYLHEGGIRVSTAEGIVTTQVRDAYGQTISLTDGEGHVTHHTYDSEGNLLSSTDAAGTTTTSYDKANHAIRTTDAGGRAVAYSYDAAGRVLTRTVDPEGLKLTTTYSYDTQGNIVTTTDPAGRKVTNHYDLEGQLTSTVQNEGGLGLTTTLTYDALGHVVTLIEGDAMTSLRVTQYTYDGAGRLLSTVLDPNGLKLTTTYTYDGDGNVIAVKDAAGNTSRTVYDNNNRAIYSIDPLGAVTATTYDAAGNLVGRTVYATAIDPSAFATQAPTAATMAAKVVSLPGDRVTRYAYDADNRLRFIQQPNGVVTEQTYDRDGNVVRSGMYTQLGTIGADFSVAAVTQAFAGIPERATHYVYDAAGRLAYRLDPAGIVTATTYDAAGVVTSTTVYATAYTDNPDATLAQLQSWSAQVHNVADHVTRNFHDAAGRTVYTVDAGGYVTSYAYDASGNVIEQHRHVLAVAVNDTTTTATVAALVSATDYDCTLIGYDAAGRMISRTDGEGVVTRYGLDALGRSVSETDAYGTSDVAISTRVYDVNDEVVTEVRSGVRDASGVITNLITQYVYDAMGRRIQTIDPRGVLASNRSDNTADALAARKLLGIVDTAGNGKAGANLTDADIALIRSYYTTRTDYDAMGRVVATHSPYGGLTAGQPTYATITTTYDAFGDAVKIVDARGGVGYFYYDKAGQVIGQVDPAGHYTQTVRDLFGNTVTINAYAGVSLGIGPDAPPAGVGTLATTRLTYDVLNRLTSTTDAMGGVESYTYDLFGDRTSLTNKLGGTTTYVYDTLGHVVRETLPISTTNGTEQAITVVNTYEYDSRGNRIYAHLALGSADERGTLYRYDNRNLLVATYTGDLTHISRDGTSGDGVGVVIEQRNYDVRGNLVAISSGPLSAVLASVAQPTTYYYYDQANRLIAQISPDGAYARNVYDAAGNKIKTLAYLAPVPNGGGLVPPPLPTSPSPFARETDYTYDAANRLVAQYQPNVVAAQVDGSKTTFSTAMGIFQSWRFDASGQLVSHTDGAGHVTRTWYDPLGHAILSLDGNGFATVWTRDADGNVLTETRYATKYAGDPAAIADPLAVHWTTSSNDRVTNYTYDTNGRVLSQTVKGVSYGVVNGNGALNLGMGDAVTRYAYDAAGNLLRQTDANGSLFAFTYDLAGRTLSQSSPSFTDYAGHVVQVTTAYVYNAHNDVLRETRSGGPTGADQVNIFQYDQFGNVVSQTNASGVTTTMAYDAWNNLVRLSNPLTDASGVKRDQVITITYDMMNRETSRVTWMGGVSGVVRNTRYDVFGEVTGRGTGGVYQETTDYDLAGRVLRTNADQGRTKIYLYDGNGNATIAIESQTSDLSMVSVLLATGVTNTDAIFGTPDVVWTMTVYDGQNQVVDIIQPTMDLSTAYLGLQAQPVPGGAPGQVSVSVGGPVGPATHIPTADPFNPLGVVPTQDALGQITAGFDVSASVPYDWKYVNAYVQVPDLSSLVSNYDILLRGPDPSTGAWDADLGYFTGNPQSVSCSVTFPPQAGWPYQVWINFDIIVIDKSTGVQTKIGSVGGSGYYVDPRGQEQDSIDWDQEPQSITGFNSSPKLKLSSADSAQLNAGAVADQIYVRPSGTSMPYVRLGITPGNPATADLSGLPYGAQYDVLYVSERPDGTVTRTEKYVLVTGTSPALYWQDALASGAPAGTQVSGAGTFIMTSDALVGVDMTQANGLRAYRATFAYRPWGSAGGYGWSPTGTPLVAGTTSMSLAGIPDGDYEIILYMTDAAGNVLQQLNGRMIKGSASYISLSYPPSPSNITLTNLPPGATTASIVFTNQRTGQSIATGALTITTPGSLVWTMPQAMLDASGALTNWTTSISFSDGRVQPPMTYSASGTISVGTARPQVPFGVTVQGNLFTLSFNPVTPSNQPITAGQYMVLRFWQVGTDIVNHPELIQRRIIQKNPTGQYVWDSVGMDPTLTFEYNYDIYATQAETQNAASATSLTHNNGYFTPKNSPANQEAHWVIDGVNNRQVTVHRSQAWDAFGEVISETDGNGNTTDLAYNALGKLTTRTEASVSITYANGYKALVRPTTQYFYDLTGRQVGLIDANGHVTTQTWNNALNKVAMEYHADGGVISHQYDALGDERVRITALAIGLLSDVTARRTDYTYDALNRLIRADGPVVNGQRAFDTYTYDEMDRRIAHTNVLGRDTVAFDVEGNVSTVTSAAGRTTIYTTIWNASADGGRGAWVQTTTLPYNLASAYAEDHVVHTLVDVRSSFGQALSHTDGAGRLTTFSYYSNGLLKQQGNSSYTYYNNGLLRTITDDITGIRETFEYDNNGNVTFDGLTNRNAQWAFQQSVSQYDALNRLVKVTDPRYTIDYEYDAMGNRIHMNSVYTDGLGKPNQVQDYWYEYDMMNRFTVTMGQLSGGVRGTSQSDTSAHVIAGNGGDGINIGYNAFGERVSATYAYDNHNEHYDYDADGYLTATTIHSAAGVVTGTAIRTNDLAGRVTHYVETSNGQNVQDITHVYDADSLVTKDIDNAASAKAGHEVGTTTDRLADGTVKATHTYGEATTVTTSYTYVWFDSEKQSEIKVQASDQSVASWNPGLSAFTYDSEGRLVQAVDVAGGRAFNYQLDAEGRILQRDELLNVAMADNHTIIGGVSNRFHSYYYMDGNQIGNVGNDGPERIDYARELAEHMDQSSNKDDSHKRFTPVAFADFDANYQPINSTYPGTAPTSYIVHSGDTLPGIAQAIWGDSSLWWMLADANNLTLDVPLVPNTVLTVPNKVTNIHNNNTTVRPYDPGKAIGNTQPTLPNAPPPPASKGGSGGCGGILQIVAIVVAVVATIYTAGAAAGLIGTAMGVSTAAGFAGGVAALSGAYGATIAVAAGAIGGTIGSIAAQGTLIAGGAQSSLDWKGVAMGAVGGAISGGIGSISVGGQTLAQSISAGTSGAGLAVAEGAGAAAGTSLAGSVLGLQSFSWRDVAAGAVSSGVGYGTAQKTGQLGWDATAKRVSTGLVAGVSSAAVHGNLSQSWQGIAQNVVGSTVGNAIADEISSRQSIPQIDTRQQYDVDPEWMVDSGGIPVQGGAVALQAPSFNGAAVVSSAAGPTIQWRQGSGETTSDGTDASDPAMLTLNPTVSVGDLEEVASPHYSAADTAMFTEGLFAEAQYRRDATQFAQVTASRQAIAAADAAMDAAVQAKIQSEGQKFVALQGSLAAGGIVGGLAAASPLLAVPINAYGVYEGSGTLADGLKSGSPWQVGIGAVATVASAFGLSSATEALAGSGSVTAVALRPGTAAVPISEGPESLAGGQQAGRNYWTQEPVEFNANKVYQRNDLIDPYFVDQKSGMTNLELMQSGRAPIGPDGQPINLHHMLQTQDGPIAELTQTFHQQNYSSIHINAGSNLPSGINRSAFNSWRTQYWMNRANDFTW